MKKRLSVFFLITFLLLSVHQLRKDYRRHREGFSSYKPISIDRVTEKKKFVVVIPSYCNEKYAEKNLRSVFEQDFDNYRVIYIDDCSNDRTLEIALKVTERFGMQERVKFIRNSSNRGRTANDYYAIHSCENDEIIVCLDGDDWFAHTGVLSELNRYYNDENIWMTYGQTMTYPNYERCGGKEPLFNRLNTGNVRAYWHCFRYYEWIFNQPRTFYAGLFKRLKVKDLFYEGKFTKVVGDVAMIYPLLEMARGHVAFVPNIAYIYNKETPLSDGVLRKKTQDEMHKVFFAKDPYPPLLEDPRNPIKKDLEKSVMTIIFSQENPLGLYDFLNAFEKRVEGKGEIVVFYSALETSSKEQYPLIEEMYPSISFVEDQKSAVFDWIKHSSAEYILFTNDTLCIKNSIDLHEAAFALERTGANGFFFNVNLDLPSMTQLGNGESVWPMNQVYNVEMTLYRKEEVERIGAALWAHTGREFIAKWKSCSDSKGMGVTWYDQKVN